MLHSYVYIHSNVLSLMALLVYALVQGEYYLHTNSIGVFYFYTGK